MKQIVKGILETYFRAMGKSPDYFKYIKGIIIAVIAIMAGLTVIQDNDIVQLPVWLAKFTGWDSMALGGLVWFLSSLPTENPKAIKDKVEEIVVEEHWEFDPTNVPQGYFPSTADEIVNINGSTTYAGVAVINIQNATSGMYYLKNGLICTALSNASSQSQIVLQIPGGPTYIAIPTRRPK